MGGLRGLGMLFDIELVADGATRAYLPKEKMVGELDPAARLGAGPYPACQC